VVKEEVAVLIVLVRRHRRAVGAAVRRAVNMRSRARPRRRRAQLRCAVCPQAFWMRYLYMCGGMTIMGLASDATGV